MIETFTSEDGTWSAEETIMDWEASDCESVSRTEFPTTGDYSTIPQFATASVTTIDWDGTTGSEISDTCYITEQRTPYLVWMKDAFRNCVLDYHYTVRR